LLIRKERTIVFSNQKSRITNQELARGFTLTELLLVASIIVLLGGLGGGLYVGTYKKLLVEKTARQFLLTARYARLAAVEQQRPYELQLGKDNKGFLLATTMTQTDTGTGPTEQIPVRDLYCRPVVFEGDVQFEAVQIVPLTAPDASEADLAQKITFLPSGCAAGAVVQIGDGKTHYTIAVVAATGKATLYEGPAAEVRTASIDLDMQQE
jgi:prepilin-type N-terminal cleavage/methylation domain-containing protein